MSLVQFALVGLLPIALSFLGCTGGAGNADGGVDSAAEVDGDGTAVGDVDPDANANADGDIPTDADGNANTDAVDRDTAPDVENGGFGFSIFPILQLFSGASLDQTKLTNFYSALDPLDTTWLRMGVNWEYVESTKGIYHWAPFDLIVDELVGHGLEILFFVGDAPPWAAANHPDDCESVPPDDPQSFADFLTVLATRYQGRVSAYAIWNEPNNPAYWANRQSTPQQYYDLLVPAYQAIKDADPNATVVCGTILLQFLTPELHYDYLDDFLALGGLDYCDAISVHIYPTIDDTCVEQFEAVLDTATSKIRAYGNTPIWLTETGTPSRQLTVPFADRTAQQVAMVEAQYARSDVNRIFWFQFSDGLYNMGITDNEFVPKEAYNRLLELMLP